MKLVRIEAGEFDMGSPDTEVGRNGNETRHHVTLTKPFWMGATEVTRRQFDAFARAADYKTDAEKEGSATVWNGMAYQDKKGASWRDFGLDQAEDHPVVVISWNDAVAFCGWLSKKESKRYRLPTEAEWEYAARGGDPRRGGTTTAYPWGDDPAAGKGHANAADLTAKRQFNWGRVFDWEDGFVFAAPAGSFQPNALGLYDMIGNAGEWCADWYGDYPEGAVTDPQGADGGQFRVFRGGSWFGDPQRCRLAYRYISSPDGRGNDVGFRVALESD